MRDMFGACEHMCAVNFLTIHGDVERMNPSLYYANPGAILDFCLNQLSKNAVLTHNYGIWDFTIQVFKRP